MEHEKRKREGKGLIRLWHDDVRPPPEGWVWARTNMEAKKYLRTGQVEEISMDHDLGLDHIDIPEEITTEELHQFLSLRGDGPHNGLELARWMVANKIFPAKITIHSWNVRAGAMRATFQDAGIACSFIPFVPIGGWMEYKTKTGRVLTDADIEELSKEAEEGYDVNHLLAKRKVITPLEVVVDLLKDALISIEDEEKEMAITQIRQAVELIKVSDNQ